MSEQATVLKRMIDVTISLATASRYHQKLNRIRLQKFIYLLDIVGYMYEVLPPAANHISYNNGPYDSAIQNAVDSLAFRGLVQISDVEHFPNANISCQYSLTTPGKKWAETLTKTEELSLRFAAANSVGNQVDKLGWWRLTDLVYAEPTYIQKKHAGFGQRIDITEGTKNSAAYLIGLIEKSLGISSKQAINQELAVDVFFKFLDNYDLNVKGQSHSYGLKSEDLQR